MVLDPVLSYNYSRVNHGTGFWIQQRMEGLGISREVQKTGLGGFLPRDLRLRDHLSLQVSLQRTGSQGLARPPLRTYKDS